MNIEFSTGRTEFHTNDETSFIFEGPFLEVSLENESDARLIFEDLIERRLVEGKKIDTDDKNGVEKFVLTLSMLETDDGGCIKPAPLMVSTLRTALLSIIHTPVDNNPVPDNQSKQFVPRQLEESFVNEIVFQYMDYMVQQRDLYKKAFYLKDYDQDIEINFSDYVFREQIVADIIENQARKSCSFFSILPRDILKKTFFRHVPQSDLKNLVGYHTKKQQEEIREILKELFSLEEKDSEPSFFKNMICAEPNPHVSRIKAVLEELAKKGCIIFIERKISGCRLRVLQASELPQYRKQDLSCTLSEEQASGVVLRYMPAHDSDSDDSYSELDSPQRLEETTYIDHFRLDQNMFVITHCNFDALNRYYREHEDELERRLGSHLELSPDNFF